MALFDKDNPGKNLANATLWLESSKDSNDFDDSGGGGCLPGSGCTIIALLMALIAVLSVVLVTCVSYTI